MGYTYLKLCKVLTAAESEASSELDGVSRQVLLDHKCDLEYDSVIELAEIKTCKLFDLLKSVNESISMNEELS